MATVADSVPDSGIRAPEHRPEPRQAGRHKVYKERVYLVDMALGRVIPLRVPYHVLAETFPLECRHTPHMLKKYLMGAGVGALLAFLLGFIPSAATLGGLLPILVGVGVAPVGAVPGWFLFGPNVGPSPFWVLQRTGEREDPETWQVSGLVYGSYDSYLAPPVDIAKPAENGKPPDGHFGILNNANGVGGNGYEPFVNRATMLYEVLHGRNAKRFFKGKRKDLTRAQKLQMGSTIALIAVSVILLFLIAVIMVGE